VTFKITIYLRDILKFGKSFAK